MRHIVYKTVNLINNNYYYGVYDTNRNVKNYLGSGLYLKRAVKKYGEVNFKRITIKLFEIEQDAYDYEKSIITKELIDSDNCYNINIGGQGGKHKHSESTKKILSEKAKLRIGIKNSFFGKTHTKESKEKISEKQKSMSEETKLKMSLAAKERYRKNGGIKGSSNYITKDESESFKK